MASSGGSTKQLKQVLGFWDLMGASIGQIIGAGIMTLLGSALAMTGRSVPLALGVAALITIAQFLPMLFISGTVRLRGGRYTMVAMVAGEKLAGAYSIIYIFSNLSLSMYALSFASYFVSLFGIGNEKIIALVLLTLFMVLNCLGIDKFAKVQNIIVACLIIALGLFAAVGVTKIAPGYFAPETFMTDGMLGLLQAGGLLSFATGGATCIIDLSAEAKNPTRDIPLVIITSTLAVAALYAVIGVVAGGVLPLQQVAGQNLSLVAKTILAKPLYVFFMVCGAGFALVSTLNSQMAWAPKPTMQACDDGWLPAGLAKLNKHNSPVIILGVLYVIAFICISTGLSVSVLGNMCLVASNATILMICAFTWKLPKVCPEYWADSKFKCSDGMLKLVSVIGTLGCAFNIWLNFTRLSRTLQIINLVVIFVALVFGAVRSKHAHMEISYEKA